MIDRIPGFTLGVAERLDPFDENADLAARSHLFIHLSGRGGSSYLFPATLESEIIPEAERTIPMGSTQIWVLEWRCAVRPRRRGTSTPAQRRAAEALRAAKVQEGTSYVLLGEDGHYLGSTTKLHAALGAAKVMAAGRNTRVAVSRLKADITWH